MDKQKEIKKLSVFQQKQKDYLLKEYPMLDDLQIDTLVRLTDAQRDAIVADMKEGKLKNEEALKPEQYIIQDSVSISSN